MSSLDQSMFMAKAADVASLRVRPSRSDEIQSQSGTRAPDVVPLYVKRMSCLGLALVKSGSMPEEGKGRRERVSGRGGD